MLWFLSQDKQQQTVWLASQMNILSHKYIHRKLSEIGMDSGDEIVAPFDEDIIFQVANKKGETLALKILIPRMLLGMM